MTVHILVLGATSTIAEHTMRLFAAQGARLLLVSRDNQRLQEIAADLRVRGASRVDVLVSDLSDIADAGARFRGMCAALGGRIDILFLAYGTLGLQQELQADPDAQSRLLTVNFVSPAAWIALAADDMEAHKSGAIAVITSVAGDRGRASLYIYGSAKAGLIAYLSGLRQRLAPSGIAVLDIRPGPVDTPMTGGKGPLIAKPEIVARDIYRAIAKRQSVAYTPGIWRVIMTVIKLLPRPIFHKLKI